MAPTQLMDELTYISYAHNRERTPTFSPKRWVGIYGNKVPTMENRLLSEHDCKADDHKHWCNVWRSQ